MLILWLLLPNFQNHPCAHRDIIQQSQAKSYTFSDIMSIFLSNRTQNRLHSGHAKSLYHLMLVIETTGAGSKDCTASKMQPLAIDAKELREKRKRHRPSCQVLNIVRHHHLLLWRSTQILTLASRASPERKMVYNFPVAWSRRAEAPDVTHMDAQDDPSPPQGGMKHSAPAAPYAEDFPQRCLISHRLPMS